MAPAARPQGSVAFGRFRVSPHRRELLADGQPIKLGGRAFDLLLALIEAHGAVIGKDALMSRIWPGRIVEESNLQVQIATLRAAFGADRELIRTVSGRGYQFTGDIHVLSESPGERTEPGVAAAQPEAFPPPTNLPEVVSELFGRDQELHEVANLAATRRLVTLTGAGGIGKTRLALAVARQLLPQFADGVWLAELTPLADPSLVPVVLAGAVGLELAAGASSAQRVADALSGKRLLVVLDNCEHLIDASATMAETLWRAGTAVHVITTSREPLRIEGEWVYPVPSLAVPAADAADDEDPLRYGAVRMFVERARAAEPRFAPDRRGTTVIAAICRRLDGIPLAIELAAARAATLGIEEVAARIDNRFHLLTGGRRTALPRHQTLRATLDWSHELLAEPERMVLRRLAVFAGPFSLEAASAVVAGPDISPPEVVEGLLSLVTKSLVAAELDVTIARYRLLDTTRAYVLEKLAESGEREGLARRHAEYYRDFFQRPEAEWVPLVDYGLQIDNVRAALDWAFLPDGDTAIGIALTAAAVPLWMHLSLNYECHGRVEQALASLGPAANRDARCEMKLHAALGTSLIYTRGAARPETGDAWTKALEIAESLDAREYQLRSLWGLWRFHTAGGRHRVALSLAQGFCDLAAKQSDPNDTLVGERMIGVSHHHLGDQRSARRHLERVLAQYVPAGQRSQVIRFQLDLSTGARVFLARVLWLQGLPEQAMRAAETSIEDGRAAYHAISLCYALTLGGCLIALLVGDLALAERYLEKLLDHSARHVLPYWRGFAHCHQGALAIKRGDLDTGLRLLRTGLDELGDSGSSVRFVALLMTEAMGHAGQVSEGLAAVDEAIHRSEQTEERWYIAELLRIKGELLLLQGLQGAVAAAEDHFRQALDWARRQDALSWELRAATSLARLLRDQGRSTEAVALLRPIYDRFTEGFHAVDLKAAEALLHALHEESEPSRAAD